MCEGIESFAKVSINDGRLVQIQFYAVQLYRPSVLVRVANRGVYVIHRRRLERAMGHHPNPRRVEADAVAGLHLAAATVLNSLLRLPTSR